jgi:AcrR family transcriptional regulator
VVHFFQMAYRPTARTEARKAATRERIVDAAIAQLGDGGYASASVQVVARRAGVATGTVYRHFPSKAELFAEVFRRASQREMDVLAASAAPDGRPVVERIAAAVEAFARRALAAPTRAYALIAEPVDPAVEAERLVFRRGYRDIFDRVLREGIAAGEIAPHDTQTLAAALVGALGETLVGPLSPAANGGTPRRRHEALIASIVQLCLNAIPREEARGRSRAHA